jgi:hypothetical protein
MLSRLSSSCSKTAWTKAGHCWKLHSTAFLPQRSITRQFTKLSPSQPWLQKQRVTAHIPKRVFTTKPPATTVVKEASKKTQAVAVQEVADNKGRNATDWAIIKQLMKYIWPKNDIGVKSRVVIALSLLIGGKVRFI